MSEQAKDAETCGGRCGNWKWLFQVLNKVSMRHRSGYVRPMVWAEAISRGTEVMRICQPRRKRYA